MTVLETIRALLDHPMGADVYIGKGMGPLTTVSPDINDRIFVVLSPGKPHD